MPARPPQKRIVAVLGVHHHMSFQLPVLCKLFPACLTHFSLTKVLKVFVHRHVTSQLSLHIKTLWTVGAEKVTIFVLMRLLMAFKTAKIIGRIIALHAEEVAHMMLI